MDWREVISTAECSYILGNPPFVGKHLQNASQKADMKLVCGTVKGSGVLDYVTGWYFKAGDYVKTTGVRVAFVSTNSISQGEQPGVLWGDLFSRFHLKIQFAHRSFQWESEARGKAHVQVVIIGFGIADVPNKRIWDYDADPNQPMLTSATNINPYLVAGSDTCMFKRREPICPSEPMIYGSKPVDGGHLILSREEKAKLLAECPEAAPFLRRLLGSDEFINGIERWCIWLAGAQPTEWRNIRAIRERVETVREFRAASIKAKTVEQSAQPYLFGELRQPSSDYLAVPEVSAETRHYIPIGMVSAEVIASNLLYTVPSASPFTFGMLSSHMHMAWMRQVAGRLESRYRYSTDWFTTTTRGRRR